MDIIFNRTVVNKVQEMSEQLENIKSMSSFEPKWSVPGPFATVKIGKGPGGTVLGVYRIIYKSTGETMSIGQGRVFGRRTRHKSVFLNGGEDVVSPNGHVSPSQTAKKMFIYDSNIDNWLFQFCFIPNKQLCSEYEKLLQENEEPEFNLLSMGGNN